MRKPTAPCRGAAGFLLPQRKALYGIGVVCGSPRITAHIELSFLDSGVNYRATIYRDGEDSHYDTNPYPVIIEERDVNTSININFT